MPNVFYELGIAPSTVKDRCIILSQSIQDIPFDLRHLRCIEYENSIAGAARMKSDLGAAIRNLRAPNLSNSTPVTGEHLTYFRRRLVTRVDAKRASGGLHCVGTIG